MKAFSASARKVVLALVVAGIVLVATLVDFSTEGLFTPYVELLLLKILLGRAYWRSRTTTGGGSRAGSSRATRVRQPHCVAGSTSSSS